MMMKCKLRNKPRDSSAQALAEFLTGLAFLIPVVLGVVDLSILFESVACNSNVCWEVAKAISSGPPRVLAKDIQNRVIENTIRNAKHSAFFQVRPLAIVSEKLHHPLSTSGGPVDGEVTVETTVDVHPPFVIGRFVGIDGISFKSKQSLPYTYVVPARPDAIHLDPSDDMWQASIVVKTLDNYLDYPGSSLYPVVKTAIVYAQESEGIDKPKAYEDYLYGNAHTIGCARHGPLNVRFGTEGIIFVTQDKKSSMNQTEAHAAANSIGRLFLALSLKRCLIKQIVLPSRSFESILNELFATGFRSAANLNFDQPYSAGAILQVVSDAGETTNIMY
jgi:hypothetical protein